VVATSSASASEELLFSYATGAEGEIQQLTKTIGLRPLGAPATSQEPNAVVSQIHIDTTAGRVKQVDASCCGPEMARTWIRDAAGTPRVRGKGREPLVLKRHYVLSGPNPANAEEELVRNTWDVGTNALGRLGTVKDEGGTTTFSYDAAGRIEEESHLRTGLQIPLKLGYTYYPGGQLKRLAYRRRWRAALLNY
jgi:YD repeat-containing protein